MDSDDETKTPSPSPHHGRSRPPSLIADSSSESDDGDARGEVRAGELRCFVCCVKGVYNKHLIFTISNGGTHLKTKLHFENKTTSY